MTQQATTTTTTDCINNTTAVWNLTPPVNIALIPQQHVIHEASKYQSRYDRYR